MSDLTILHVNDMHSNFHSLKTQTNFMRARRKELEELGHTVWAVDLGDLIDRVHPLVEAKNGQIASTILNQQKIDFVTLYFVFPIVFSSSSSNVRLDIPFGT